MSIEVTKETGDSYFLDKFLTLVVILNKKLEESSEVDSNLMAFFVNSTKALIIDRYSSLINTSILDFASVTNINKKELFIEEFLNSSYYRRLENDINEFFSWLEFFIVGASRGILWKYVILCLNGHSVPMSASTLLEDTYAEIEANFKDVVIETIISYSKSLRNNVIESVKREFNTLTPCERKSLLNKCTQWFKGLFQRKNLSF